MHTVKSPGLIYINISVCLILDTYPADVKLLHSAGFCCSLSQSLTESKTYFNRKSEGDNLSEKQRKMGRRNQSLNDLWVRWAGKKNLFTMDVKATDSIHAACCVNTDWTDCLSLPVESMWGSTAWAWLWTLAFLAGLLLAVQHLTKYVLFLFSNRPFNEKKEQEGYTDSSDVKVSVPLD